MTRNEVLTEIDKAAAMLPDTFDKVIQETQMLGRDLLLLNKKTVGGKPIDERTMYFVKMAKFVPRNHNTEMRKLYLKERERIGHEAAYELVATYIKLVMGNVTITKTPTKNG